MFNNIQEARPDAVSILPAISLPVQYWRQLSRNHFVLHTYEQCRKNNKIFIFSFFAVHANFSRLDFLKLKL